MSEFFPYIISLFVGIGLAAASGFRVFLPLFFISLASYFDWIPLANQWSWMGSTTTLIATGIAMLVEICAYYIPFVDNILDSITVPLATLSGTLIFASQFTDLPPILQWSSALIAGGGTSALISSLTAGARATSSVSTAGVANPILSTFETIISSVMTFLSIFIPIIAVILTGVIIFFGFKYGKKALAKFK